VLLQAKLQRPPTNLARQHVLNSTASYHQYACYTLCPHRLCLLWLWHCVRPRVSCCYLQAHPNSIALFVPAEITTYCFYPGKIKDYLVANAIFRMGGAAVLMTNKPSLVKRCKYQLTHAVRVHTGQDDAAYRCEGRQQHACSSGGARAGMASSRV
jgi:hypothetical protein